MNIPSVPTDNLYKFMALSGVFVLALSFFYEQYTYNNIHETSLGVLEQQNRVAINLSEIEAKVIMNSYEVDMLEAEDVENKGMDDVTDMVAKLSGEIEAFKGLREAADVKNDFLLESLKANTQRAMALILVMRLGGFILAASGFTFWYYKLQRHLDQSVLDKKGKT